MTYCRREDCIHYDVCAYKACKFVCPYYKCNTSGDLISREALKKAIMNDLGLGDEENGSDAEYMSGLQDCYELIDNTPTVNAENCEGCPYCPNSESGIPIGVE